MGAHVEMVMPGLLKVLIEGARDLENLVTAGEQEPFYTLECGGQRCRSKPARGAGTAPVWNTAHKFGLTDEVAMRAVIKDEVTKAVIGEAIIDLSRWAWGGRAATRRRRR
ncbi:MAG: hypothetical protein J3K34DRAFT_410948 [Monoraphidium minutum]|nr:MAG: hypothetical protein J3K34DRAFT_410948 [Monoraphidium minutum]